MLVSFVFVILAYALYGINYSSDLIGGETLFCAGLAGTCH